MKKLLGLAVVVLVALAVGVSAQAETPVSGVAALQRRVAWDAGRIHRLEARRAYLHRYIRHLRRTTTPIVHHKVGGGTGGGGVLTDAQVTGYLLGAGFPRSAVGTMLYYSHRESGNNPRAINAVSGACGLWQLYPCFGGSAWLDPATNAHFAHEKYLASGFAPWGG